MPLGRLSILDLGRFAYGPAYEAQCAHVEEVLAARDAGSPEPGRILLVEHDPPVITVSRRPGAMRHLIATPEQLTRAGVTVAETDRGGDITYHGPGQLVVYPILDLNFFRLRLHDYMRLLEGAAVDTCAAFGLAAERDACATGVWVGGGSRSAAERTGAEGGEDGGCGAQDRGRLRKICAMGVRIRRWVSMHGLAINVTTNLDHFQLIVPCGLARRPVTSLQGELGERCPTMGQVKDRLVRCLRERLGSCLGAAHART